MDVSKLIEFGKQAYDAVATNGPAVAEGLLAILGAVAALCHKFHKDGAAAPFDKASAAVKYIKDKLPTKKADEK